MKGICIIERRHKRRPWRRIDCGVSSWQPRRDLLTSAFAISGYGHPKTIVLTRAGAGELAANIRNPDDRKGAATTALTKVTYPRLRYHLQ